MLLEPPRARSTRMAFSKAAFVRILRGVTCFFTSSTTLTPLSKAILLFSAEPAMAVPHQGRLNALLGDGHAESAGPQRILQYTWKDRGTSGWYGWPFGAAADETGMIWITF